MCALSAPLASACREGGASSPEAVAAAYLSAARQGDVPALVALAPEGFDANEAATAKVAAFARVRDASIQTMLLPNDITPNEMGVDFVARDAGFKDSIRIQRFGSRWFVILGRARSPAPPFPTAQSTP